MMAKSHIVDKHQHPVLLLADLLEVIAAGAGECASAKHEILAGFPYSSVASAMLPCLYTAIAQAKLLQPIVESTISEAYRLSDGISRAMAPDFTRRTDLELDIRSLLRDVAVLTDELISWCEPFYRELAPESFRRLAFEHNEVLIGIQRRADELRELPSWVLLPVGQASIEADQKQPANEKQGRGRHPTPRQEAAYQSYQEAIRRNPDLAEATDREVHSWVREYGIAEEYTLPAFETWARYVRAGRKYHDARKSTPRAGRPHGRSIIEGSEADYPRTPEAD